MQLAVNFVAAQVETLKHTPTGIPKGQTVTGQAMTSLCQTLLSANEFLYIE